MHCGCGQKAGVAAGQPLLVVVFVTVGQDGLLYPPSARTREMQSLGAVSTLDCIIDVLGQLTRD